MILGTPMTPPVPYHHQVKPLSSEQKELIHRLVYFQDQYEAPSEKDMKRLTINNVPNYKILFIRLICASYAYYFSYFYIFYSKIGMNMMKKNKVIQRIELSPR